MKKLFLISVGSLALLGLIFFAGSSLLSTNSITEDEENEMYDGPDQADVQEFEKIRDIKLNRIPQERLLMAINGAAESRANRAAETSSLISWSERGPNSDSVGTGNGNTRANGGITAGRVLAMMVDANDATGNTVFAGGIDGGLWKTTNIDSPNATWTPVNDFLSNLAISDVVQDTRPGHRNEMYFGTGEGYRNGDAVRGNGIFKSVDGGATWAFLPNTASFAYTTRMAVDSAGNVYAGTRISGGLFRSSDGGATWTNITPSGLASVDVTDIKISSTGRMHVSFGMIAGNSYRFTDSPATATSGAGWNSATTPFTVSSIRTELAVSGNTLYATPSDASYQVPTIFKSTNGGVDWAATTTQPASGWASQQAWYAMAIAINPSDPNQVIVGGLDNYKSSDGGATWTKISAWVGTTGQYVHADQHKSIWYDNGNKLLFGSDGGVFYSTDGGVTTRDRNTGLRIKQFYSVAMRPEAGNNYLLAGAQDNGTHSLSNAGLDASVEVTGGDGAYVAIDQDNPNNQFGAYVYGQYRYSTNGGATWSNRNFSSTLGRFTNPFELDSTANNLYAADGTNIYRRWLNAPVSTTSTTVTVANMGGQVSSVTVSPYTANRVVFGTGSGTIVRVDGADTFVSGGNGTLMSTGFPSGTYVSNVAYGTTDNNLIASVTNYGSPHVLISTDGSSWSNVTGNLPDMPVRWAIFKPGSNTAAVIGTEAGVWETDAINGSSTVWVADPSFPSCRVDMIRYRPSDGMLAAATHGRGVWVSTSLSPVSTHKAISDFDGDGRTDVSVYRPSTGQWFANRSTAGFTATSWGISTDQLVPADYDGDGKADYAVYRPSDVGGVTDFYILNSSNSTISGYSHGLTTDIPVTGDTDGDGKADVIVFRPSTGTWFMVESSTQAIRSAQFGQSGDLPLAFFDSDGDGKSNLAVYRPSTNTFYIAKNTGTPGQSFDAFQFGTAGDVVVPGDYDGDGKTDVAVFRPSTGYWFVLQSSNSAMTYTQFGASGDSPVAGDYDGDGKTDVAVYRGGVWYINGTTAGFSAQNFGLATDKAVPSTYHP